ARAFVTDQLWPLGTSATWPGQTVRVSPDATRNSEVTRRYEEAMGLQAVVAEARMRAAWFSYRIGRFDQAVRLLDGITGAAPDRQIVYLSQLVRGHALRAL